jgi:hypothetical protein
MEASWSPLVAERGVMVLLPTPTPTSTTVRLTSRRLEADDARGGPAALSRMTPHGWVRVVGTPDAKLAAAPNLDASSGLRFS